MNEQQDTHQNFPPAQRLPLTQRLHLLARILLSRDPAVREAYVDYHLIRRKFILSRSCEHFALNKFEPAPLLNHSLLDIGCGTTRLAEELCFRGAECTAIDINDDVLHLAERSAQAHGSPVQFLLATAEDLVREGKSYDIVLCLDVLEHVEDPKRLLWACSKIMGPNGLLVFSTVNRTWRSWFMHILIAQRILGWLPRNTFKFKQFIKPDELEAMLAEHGLYIGNVCGARFDPFAREWLKTDNLALRYMGTASRRKHPTPAEDDI